MIITPYFAPQSHAAVFRAHKLAKHLAASGWQVHILTVDCNYLYNEDPALLKDFPPGVTIHRARYIEPTLRGLRMLLGGKDRTFRALKFDGAGTPAPGRRPTLLGGIYRWMRERINSPDVYWTWRKPAIRLAEKVIREHGVEVIMTSSLPYTTIEIGAELKKRTGVAWVADFRDPMSYERRLHSALPRIFNRQKSIERRAVENADAVTCLTSAHPLILADTYGVDKTKHVHFIPTGVERGLMPSGKNPGTPTPPYLVFVGEFLAEYGDEFFKIFDEAVKDPACAHFRLKIVGRREVNEARILPLIRGLQMRDNIDFIDHIPQAQVYQIIHGAKAGVLCTSRRYPWWAAFAKLSDFLALHKTVVAIVPDPSEARKWLQLSGLGIFLDGPNVSARLKEFLAAAPERTNPVEEYCRQFYVEHQVAEFDRVLTSCLAPNKN